MTHYALFHGLLSITIQRRLRRVAHFSVVLLFLISALAKAADFDGSAALVAGVLHSGWRVSRLLAGGLILAEAALGGWLALKTDRAFPLVAALAAMCLLLIASLWLWAKGATDCGCFGSLIVMAPQTAVLKNIAFIAIICALLMSRQQNGATVLTGARE